MKKISCIILFLLAIVTIESEATEEATRYDTRVCFIIDHNGVVWGPGSECSLPAQTGPCFKKSACSFN